MSLQAETISKIMSLPNHTLEEVNDFIDFLLSRNNKNQEETIQLIIAESGMDNYLSSLENYEEMLEKGGIKW